MPPVRGGAARAAGEIGFTIISITVSLVAVFIPVLLMGGVIGRIFNEFAVVVTIAIARLGLRLADADADAVRAPAEAAGTGRRAASCSTAARARLRRRACGLSTAA